MTTKVALFRDVAKLLKKYKPAELSDAVSSLAKRRPSKKRLKSKTGGGSKRAKKVGVVTSPQALTKKSSVRAKKTTAPTSKSRKRNQSEVVRRVSRAKPQFATSDTVQKNKLVERKVGTTNQHKSGAYRDLTRTRRVQLDDHGDDYAKWFRIISGNAGETKESNLAEGSTSREAAQPNKWKGTIKYLVIRDLLLNAPFKMNSSDPNASRIITFLPDGDIGMGKNFHTARWRLAEGKLELLDMAGMVHSRFVVSADGRLLTQVVDPNAPSVRTSQLIRIAAKS